MSDKSKKIEFSDVMSQFTQATYDNSSHLLNALAKFEGYCNKHLKGLSVDFKVSPSKADLTTPEKVIIGYEGTSNNESVRGEITAFIKNVQDEVPVLSFPGEGDASSLAVSGEVMRGLMLRTIVDEIVNAEACNNAFQQVKTREFD